MSSATLGAHEIVRHIYSDEQSRKDFLEKVSKDWYNRDYHVYLWLYFPVPVPWHRTTYILGHHFPIPPVVWKRLTDLLGGPLLEERGEWRFVSEMIP
jgi:hypothetical protein